jgi:hypothetical protein
MFGTHAVDLGLSEGDGHLAQDVEHEWSAELGPADFAQLKELLFSRLGEPTDPLARDFRSRNNYSWSD